jgi:hypothetical protein
MRLAIKSATQANTEEGSISALQVSDLSMGIEAHRTAELDCIGDEPGLMQATEAQPAEQVSARNLRQRRKHFSHSRVSWHGFLVVNG